MNEKQLQFVLLKAMAIMTNLRRAGINNERMELAYGNVSQMIRLCVGLNVQCCKSKEILNVIKGSHKMKISFIRRRTEN